MPSDLRKARLNGQGFAGVRALLPTRKLELNLLFEDLLTVMLTSSVQSPEIMTFREAVMQASLELGQTREEIELCFKASDAALPEASGLTYSLVKPGLERELIEEIKANYRRMDANPKYMQWVIDEVHRRVKNN